EPHSLVASLACWVTWIVFAGVLARPMRTVPTIPLRTKPRQLRKNRFIARICAALLMLMLLGGIVLSDIPMKVRDWYLDRDRRLFETQLVALERAQQWSAAASL